MNFVLFSFSVPMLNATFKFNCTKLHQQCQTLVTICHIKSHHHFQTDRKSMLSQLTSVGSLRLTPLDLLPLWCVGKGGTKWRKYMNTCMFPHSAYPVFSYCSTVQSCKLCRVSLFCGKPLLPTLLPTADVIVNEIVGLVHRGGRSWHGPGAELEWDL